MGRLTTHVLDTSLGKPGAGIAVSVHRIEGDDARLLSSTVTNDDGRCDAPLLEGEEFTSGEYELRFGVGDYLSASGQAGGDSSHRFLDRVVLRFGVADADEHYHVPLLVSPFAYSTYRGS